MTISYDNFVSELQAFLIISSDIGDEWFLKKKLDNNMLYLEKRFTRSKTLLDDSCEAFSTSFLTFVYHIVYSESYCVPVLYINAYQEDGRPLSLDDVWEQIPDCYKDGFEEKKWHILTQQDHPIFEIPCFMIHPCYTANMMKLPFKNYIITWLSLVGPLVGLNLSLSYAEKVESFKKNTLM